MRSGADILAARASLDTATRDQETSRKQQLVTGPVIIYNAFCLLPVDKRLAANYVYVTTFVYIPTFSCCTGSANTSGLARKCRTV